MCGFGVKVETSVHIVKCYYMLLYNILYSYKGVLIYRYDHLSSIFLPMTI